MNVDAGVKLHLSATNHIKIILMYDALYTHVHTSVTDYITQRNSEFKIPFSVLQSKNICQCIAGKV
jgi:hypothetical protein